MARRKKPVIADDLLDQLLAGRDPQSVFSKDGLFDDLKRALNAEMDRHMNRTACSDAWATMNANFVLMSSLPTERKKLRPSSGPQGGLFDHNLNRRTRTEIERLGSP